jgi:hypothetical protein
MSKTAIVCSAAALVALAAPSFAQPPGITREMINTTLPLEGAPLAVAGPYQVTSGAVKNAPGLMVFHPANLDAFPARDTMPVLVWGNGGCAIDTTRYGGFLSTIASHGFLVLTTASVEGDPVRRFETVDDLRAALDWAENENERENSPLHGKIAAERMAVMGTSCGGSLALRLGADPRVDAIGAFNTGSGPDGLGAKPPSLADLHGPVLVLNGHERDPAMASSAMIFDDIDHVAVFYGARHDGNHLATYFHPGGGEFANVAASWLRFVLKGDTEAGKMFVGEDCGLCVNENWDTRAKGLN